MALRAETDALMHQLARAAFSGEVRALPGADSSRVQVYHDLVSQVFEDTLSSAFPLAMAALGGRFLELVRRFTANGPKTAPQLWRVAGEFADYVIAEGFSMQWQLPWLDDLLAFEWLEIELYMMPDLPSPDAVPFSLEELRQLRTAKLVINPEFRVHAFGYPVFRSLEPQILSEAGQHFLLGFRHRTTAKVHFVELPPPLVLALEWLAEEPRSVQEMGDLLDELAPESTPPARKGSIDDFERQLFELHREGMILGALREEL